jgi:hypothetical protein
MSGEGHFLIYSTFYELSHGGRESQVFRAPFIRAVISLMRAEVS